MSRADLRPHVPLTIYWKNGSQTQVRALEDTGAEASLIYGNPDKFKGTTLTITGLGGAEVQETQTKLMMKTGHLPRREYSIVVVPIPEYIIGIDILRGMSLALDDGNYHFAVCAFKIYHIIVGNIASDSCVIA